MRCLYPRTVGFKSDGKTISWSQKHYSKEFATFQLPCSKCLECRLEYAREWAIRCVHESRMHPKNCFITLTYSDEHLKSPKLQYKDFQDFIKRLRDKIGYQPEDRISVFVTGEYGDQNKRPHWHAIIFNWEPPDLEYLRANKRGDKIYKSKILDSLWGKNDPEKKPNEVGDVTFHSAGYVARYAAKKLGHGKDQEHQFHPISKKSSKYAIGKAFLEKHWQDIFNHGRIVLPDGRELTAVPRYYQKWLLKNHPREWERYVTQIKAERCRKAEAASESRKEEVNKINRKRYQQRKNAQISDSKVKEKIINEKFKVLNSYRTGDN